MCGTRNKSRIIKEEKCLGSIIEVLRFGLITKVKENAAVITKTIADEVGAVEAPLGLLRIFVIEAMVMVGLIRMMACGTPRGKENVVTTLLELCRSWGDARSKVASLTREFQRCENYALHHFVMLFTGIFGYTCNLQILSLNRSRKG
ncbi:hypothetical protein K2173_005425 [Erythroxylum novogranatense]|uniref:Uncharacterized protein n=1 Tax=Erythroxylum novogranatense TaxID=1862640 RepID=A0AAV8T6J7_9ROSI|nr:hypothetical protein K2173_005425 [Erythroxylum novogranatense]